MCRAQAVDGISNSDRRVRAFSLIDAPICKGEMIMIMISVRKYLAAHKCTLPTICDKYQGIGCGVSHGTTVRRRLVLVRIYLRVGLFPRLFRRI